MDDIGVGKSSSTKLVEHKLRNQEYERPVLLSISISRAASLDEYVLLDPADIADHIMNYTGTVVVQWGDV